MQRRKFRKYYVELMIYLGVQFKKKKTSRHNSQQDIDKTKVDIVANW